MLEAYIGKAVEIFFKNGVYTSGILNDFGGGLYSVDGYNPLIFQEDAVNEISCFTTSHDGQIVWDF